MSPIARRWYIHGGCLLALLILYFYLTRDAWFEKPQKPVDFSGLAAVVGMVTYLIYSLVTTAVMGGMCRVQGGPVIVHGLGMALWAGMILYKHNEKVSRDAEYQRTHAGEIHMEKQRQLLQRCLTLDELRVKRTPPMQLELHFANHGCPALTLGNISAGAFRPESNRLFLSELRSDGVKIDEGAVALITVPSVSPSDDLGSYDDWSFKATISVREPESFELQFCAGNAPKMRWVACLPIGKVTFTDSR